MKLGLAVIETPISAYMLSLVCDNHLPIDIIYNFSKDNYNVDKVVSVCSDILIDKNKQRDIVISDSTNWALENRRDASSFAKKRLIKELIMLDNYDHIYANPFTNAFGFYISTQRNITILSHGSIDYLKFQSIFFEKIKLFVRTGKWMKNPSKYYGLVDIKNPPKEYVLVTQDEKKWNISIYNFDDAIKFQSQSVLCAWTEHMSYQEAYSERMITLNLKLIKRYCDLNNTQIPYLFIKIHRRSILPTKRERENIKGAFGSYVEKVIFVDEILEKRYAEYMPAELIIQFLNIKNVIGSSSALIWNCSSMKDVKCYSFLNLGKEDLGLLEYVIKDYVTLNKLMLNPPHDFSYTI